LLCSSLNNMTDSEQYTLVEAAPDDFETMLWSPTRPDKNSFQPESANSGGSWRTQLGPIPPELLRAQEEFAATLEADCDRVSSFSRSSDYDDQGAIVGDLKKALPALLQENVALRERLYSQSNIEPGASPTADHVHEKIVNEQCKPRRKHVSRLPPDIPEYTHRHRPLLVPKTPPGSPPLKLPHFGSVSTLAAEDAPLQSQLLNENGNRNIHMLQSMRTNEIMADLAFTARLSSRPRLPEAASANEIVFLLKTQAQRRRKQIHDERTGQVRWIPHASVFSLY